MVSTYTVLGVNDGDTGIEETNVHTRTFFVEQRSEDTGLTEPICNDFVGIRVLDCFTSAISC